MGIRLLVDGDVLKYRCGFAAQKKSYLVYMDGTHVPVQEFKGKKEAVAWTNARPQYTWSIEPHLNVEPVQNALMMVRISIQAAVDRCGSGRTEVYLSGKHNYRKDMYPEYKANRKDEKPVHFEAIHNYLIRKWKACVVEDIEADDALGIEQYADYVQSVGFVPKENLGTCIATIDKDLDNIPGWHYNFMSMERYWVTPDEATLNFYRQILVGDGIDNIKGLWKVGKVTAKKILPKFLSEDQMWATVCHEYLARKRPVADAILNAKLLWIQREAGVIWEPPNGESTEA